MSDEAQPLWRWLVIGVLCTGGAIYVLVTGELAIDKARSLVVNRSSFLYWTFLVVFGGMGVLALRKAWQQLRS